MRARIIVGIVACVAALAVTGCGGDDDETTSSTTSTTTEPAGASGATGAEGAGAGESEETTAVAQVIEQSFVDQGYSEDEASCAADVISPDVADTDVTEFQEDPEILTDAASKHADELADCGIEE